LIYFLFINEIVEEHSEMCIAYHAAVFHITFQCYKGLTTSVCDSATDCYVH